MNTENIRNTEGMHTGDVVTEILNMHGIPKHKHVDHVRSVLSISSSQAHKKLKGHAQWEVTQLEAVITSLGMSMSDFYTIIENEMAELVLGLLDLDGVEIPCKTYLRHAEDKTQTVFSAVRVNDKWHVFKTEEIINNQIYMDSKRGVYMVMIESETYTKIQPSIAILDDEIGIAENIKMLIDTNDYRVDIYSQISSLEEKIKSKPYDTYILDWVINDNSVYDLISKIRGSKKPDAMIIVLTGKDSDEVDDEIASAIRDFDIIGPFSKPLKINSIQRQIDKYFSR
jgi:PleD family two-component response regulator|uniref:helix-turn-helix domain-containing protein n=1 Tax=Serratia proteamaculans TaxID=28151 RepID=UPI001F4C1C3A|nr:helix-turn-helix domain-containing protein [Serratia proteamaculans]ULG15816.1 hypothetical protein 495p2_00064 [Serratia proteamaculans]